MRRVTYAGDSFLTADSAANALVAFAAALAHNNASEAVSLPIIDSSGQLAEVYLLIGPSSELISMPEASPYADPDVTATLKTLRLRTASMDASALPAEAHPMDPPPYGSQIGDEL
ncbi:MAG: hypothetical protein H7248_07240 [Microbacteriaceae bacterium]|nr:hypothetical protein [Microbacteriaceae bacterium]